ncbi:MAG: tetratricopeptide repeat protein [Deltaproteobacteria bacterium]|nr:tetratricopeptide repeat protein [Deltaproteobacteria bacterium]
MNQIPYTSHLIPKVTQPMSYIHKALNKAQTERDNRFKEYDGILVARKRKNSSFFARTILWVSLLGIVSGLAFVSYSWFDSKVKRPSATGVGRPERPATDPVHEKAKAATVPYSGENAKALYDKAKAFHKSGRLPDAKRLYQETLKADPGYVDSLNNLGVIYIHEKNYKAAQSSFEKAIHLKPGNVDLYYNLACVYALKGDIKQGLANLKRACSLDHAARTWAGEDADLNNLRGVPEFKEIIGVEGLQR